jgi:hypothetical protein
MDAALQQFCPIENAFPLKKAVLHPNNDGQSNMIQGTAQVTQKTSK